MFSNIANAGYLVHGRFGCGQILDDDKNDVTVSMYQTKSYIQGFITGLNYAKDKYKGKGVKSSSLYYSVIKFCKENPLKEIHQAAEDIYFNQLK
tara:strand:+ start:247 stop:528 length:282 start_codon:yes stop_codon:yes gene_type:complete